MAVDGRASRTVTAVPAGSGDGQGLPAVRGQRDLDVGRSPAEVVADSGCAGAAAYRTCVDRGVVPTIKERPYEHHHDGWDRDGFIYDAALDRDVCSIGERLVSIMGVATAQLGKDAFDGRRPWDTLNVVTRCG